MATSAETTDRRAALIATLLISLAIGVAWDLLAALLLFRSYLFFESVVVCLLVMILCSIATLQADLGPGGFLFHKSDKREEERERPREALRELRALFKSILYGIAFAMGAVKLVMTLIGHS